MMHRNNRSPKISLLTDNDVRDMISSALIRMCAQEGPSRVAIDIGCEEKTVRRARDKERTLSPHFMANLLAKDGSALDPILAHFGRRSVPIEAVCDADVMPSLTGAVHKLAVATSPTSPGGPAIVQRELLNAEHDLRSAFDVIGGLLQRIERIKMGEAA